MRFNKPSGLTESIAKELTNASVPSSSTLVPVCARCRRIPQMSREHARLRVERLAVPTVQRRPSHVSTLFLAKQINTSKRSFLAGKGLRGWNEEVHYEFGACIRSGSIFPLRFELRSNCICCRWRGLCSRVAGPAYLC